LEKFVVLYKKRMKLIILNLFIFAAIVTGCTKPNDSSVLQLRVRNMTAKNFTSTSTAGAEFGSINAGAVTGYKNFDQIVAYPGANFISAKDTTYAGSLYCGTPPLPYLENGKYTLEIFADTGSYSGYNAKFIKD
jgi:hypothetical protein